MSIKLLLRQDAILTSMHSAYMEYRQIEDNFDDDSRFHDRKRWLLEEIDRCNCEYRETICEEVMDT